MKYLHYYIPFFGEILLWMEDDWTDFNFKNPHYWTTAIYHGILWAAICAG